MSNNRPLPDNLQRLGIEDVKERLELSTLAPVEDLTAGFEFKNCCTCKIGNDNDLDNPDDDGGDDD